MSSYAQPSRAILYAQSPYVILKNLATTLPDPLTAAQQSATGPFPQAPKGHCRGQAARVAGLSLPRRSTAVT